MRRQPPAATRVTGEPAPPPERRGPARVWLLGRVGAAFIRRGWQEAVSYRSGFLLRLVGLATTLAAMVFFSRFVDAEGSGLPARYGRGYLGFGLVGLVLLNLQQTIVSAYPTTIRAAQLAGTLEALLATPTPSWVVLLCSPLYGILAAFGGAIVTLALGALTLGTGPTRAGWPLLLVGLALAPLAFAGLGFCSATLTMLLRRSDPLSFFLGGTSALAGGVFYPTVVLPGWLRAIGELLPLTHALELVRCAAFGTVDGRGALRALIGLALTGAIAVPIGLTGFVWAVRRARQDGSLSHY